jgi:hypothetical protein
MSLLGWILAAFGGAGIIFGVRMFLKLKKMTTVPFWKPSEIAKKGAAAADAKGMVSTEGQVGASALLTAPMSGQPCLAYELLVELKWEQQDVTEKGTETKKGKNNVYSQYQGGVFDLVDGAGAIKLDLAKKPDATFEQSHTSTIPIGATVPGMLEFGRFELERPRLPDDRRTVAFVGTEKIVKPSPTLFAMGQLKGTTLGEPSGAFSGKLTLSTQGRAHLLAATKRNQLLGFAVGALLAIGGTGLGVFAPKPASASGQSCAAFADTTECNGRMFEKGGIDYSWTVTRAGTYKLVVKMPPGLKYPVDPNLSVFDAEGHQLEANTGARVGADAVITRAFDPGTYRVNVRDFARTIIKGGYSFKLSVSAADATPAAVVPGAPLAAAESSCVTAVKCCTMLAQGNGAAVDACKSIAGPACDPALDGYKTSLAALGKTVADCK